MPTCPFLFPFIGATNTNHLAPAYWLGLPSKFRLEKILRNSPYAFRYSAEKSVPSPEFRVFRKSPFRNWKQNGTKRNSEKK